MAQYPSNPSAPATFVTSGKYMDVALSAAGNSFSALSITDCNLGTGNALEWFNPAANAGAGAWLPVSPTPTMTIGPPACLSFTVTSASSPTLAELTGTVFSVAVTPVPASGYWLVAADDPLGSTDVRPGTARPGPCGAAVHFPAKGDMAGLATTCSVSVTSREVIHSDGSASVAHVMGDPVVSGGRIVEESGGETQSRADLAGVLSALCCECAEFTGILACSVVLNDDPFGFFSATGSAEWACTLDDFQLSEETGPTWECCRTATTTHGDGQGQRGLTGSDLAGHLSVYGAVGARAVPLLRDGTIVGAVTLYLGQSTRPESLITPSAAMAATVIEAIERQRREEMSGSPSVLEVHPTGGAHGETDHGGSVTFQERKALSEALYARAAARDDRALSRDARAVERDARAVERDARARARDEAAHVHAAGQGWTDHEMIAVRVLARRDRYAAARDRFHAKSDRAAARLDRLVSAIERVESSIDGLTGAYRREAGMMELEHEITRARRTGETFVLAFVDVNNLKVRNDTHGHLAGDRLLRKIADTLRANVRSYDLVVRYGGDEFVCGFPALDVHDAAERLVRINGDLAATEEASVAYGLAQLETGDSLADLITRADSIMYANRCQRPRGGGNAANAHAATTNAARAADRVSSSAE